MTMDNTNKKEVHTKFTTLYIEPLCAKKINYYTQAADGEVSGLGTIVKDNQGRFVVKEVFLLDQQCTGTETDLNPEAISKLMVDMMKENKDPAQLKFWWHSHVNMGVFWSGTDDAACETLSHEFAFSLVVNKSRESKCRLDLYNPFRITFDGVKVVELSEADNDPLKDECYKEVKDKVKPYAYKYEPYNHNTSRYPGYEDYGDYGEHSGGHYGSHHTSKHSIFKGNMYKDNVKLPEIVVDDIKRLLDTAENNMNDGGIYSPDTWDTYIHETLKQVCELRLEPKAFCKSPLTYDPKGFPDCTNGNCKVEKKCAYFTKLLNETEEDAVEELQALSTTTSKNDEGIII